MRKERILPYWTQLEQVIPVVQVQTASNITLTLVSIEVYSDAGSGLLLTFNGQSSAPNARHDRGGHGWMQGHIVDRLGNHYACSQTMLSGIEHAHRFRGRAVMPCRSPVADQAGGLSITIDEIEWEFLDGDETQPAIEMLPGPWVFDVALP